MGRLLAWLAGTLLLLVLAAGGLILASLDSQPLVSRSATITPQSVAQARFLLLSNDPRRLRSGDARQAAIPAALIDEGVNYLASRFLHGRGTLVLVAQSAEIRVTLRPPLLPVEQFLNLSFSLHQAAGEPRIAAAKIGSLPIPPALVEFALATGIRLAGYEREWNLARHAIRELKFEPERRRVIVSYVWEPALLERARAVAVSQDDLARMRSAQEMLAALLDHKAPNSHIALPVVLGTMLDVNGSDQRENHRAAIFVLAAYLSEKNIVTLIPEAASWPRIPPVTMTLLGRNDSAQHFMVSAALAAWAGEPIADAIGLYKELADSHHGGGFSFADLAADRAGTRFGELLNRGDAKVLALVQGNLTDQDLIPPLNALPEYLNEREFRRQFGNSRSPAFQRLAEEIERRLAAMPLYQAE
ncbi:MAG TPA: hypothetical protein VLA64_01375 [Azonexus sp.]|nr:hypothetical protein [Azonexus sp.]